MGGRGGGGGGVGKCRGLAEALVIRSARAERQGSVWEAQEAQVRARLTILNHYTNHL